MRKGEIYDRAAFQGDSRAVKWGIRDLESLRAVVKMVPGRTACVQAGANVGVFPKYLARHFEACYVFEPSVELFPMMIANAPEPNIIRFQAALGESPALVGTACTRRKAGPGPIHPGLTHIDGPGIIPTLRLDDFALPVLDLLYLDLEGFELFALRGAEQTIQRCRPVIAVEINQNAGYYGITKEDVSSFIVSHGYRHALSIHSDQAFVPVERAA
jgi:FkbM family methyltransferase